MHRKRAHRSRLVPALFMAILTGCSTVATPPSTGNLGGNLKSNPALTVSFIDGMNWAGGYDSKTGAYLGNTGCFAPSSVATPPYQAPGQLVSSFSLTKVEDKSELANALDVGGTASYNAGVTKVSASARFVQSQKTDNYSVGLLLKSDATGGSFSQYSNNTPPVLTAQAKTLYDTNYKAFVDQCGDYFLNTFTLGGRYAAYYNFTTYSNAQKQEISAQLSATSGPFTLSADFDKKIQSLTSGSRLQVTAFQTAIPGQASTDPQTIITDAENYAANVLAVCNQLKSVQGCAKSAQFEAYENYFGPPDTVTAAALSSGGAQLNYLSQVGLKLDFLKSSLSVINLNPGIFDQSKMAAVKALADNTGSWTVALNAAIQGCTNNVVLCTPSGQPGAITDAETLYGIKLPTYASLVSSIQNLPAIIAALPAKCVDLQQGYKIAIDGEYYVFLNNDFNQTFKVYCSSMTTGLSPADYITLGAQSLTSSVLDFSDKDVGNPDSGGSALSGKLTTIFTKMRINLDTLVVDPNDVTFTSSVGSVTRDGVPSSAALPLGSAGQCNPASANTTSAIIDLSYTPFVFNTLQTSFVFGGWDVRSAGSAAVDANKQIYTITSPKGYCASAGPSLIRLNFVPKP